MEYLVNVGQYVISNNKDDSLKIYGLSTCIGLVVYCAKKQVLGLAHILLPESTINPEACKISPAYCADTGVNALVNDIITKYHCKREDIVAGIYGGADSKTSDDVFNIGKRNVIAVKSKLYEFKINLKENNTGGRLSRTLEVYVADGKVNLIVHKFL